jgi:predicted amidohydrolase
MEAKPMRISVLQQCLKGGYVDATGAPDPTLWKQVVEDNLEDCFRMLEQAADAGAELAVTTETINSFGALGDARLSYPAIFEGLDGPQVKRFSEAARKHRMHIVAGLLLTIDGKTYNCAVLFDGHGEIVGIHKKIHLPAGEEVNVAPGDKFEVFHTELGNIGMLVCWDMQYPEAARELALGGADLICCPTLGWENIYGLARAYENSVSIAVAMVGDPHGYVGYCDPGCIVDNMGHILAAGPRCGAAVVTADLDVTKEPEPQYNSQQFYSSHSMRKTRFSQRRPETYRLINAPLAETPLYKRYFQDNE